MTRTGQGAIDYARSRVGANQMPDSGLCLQFVRTCFDVPSYYYSADLAWAGAQRKHPGDRNPPPAVPLWFATPSPYDHVVFCCSSGEIISTWDDDVRSYPSISAVEAAFDGTFLGWAEDINRVTIWTPEDDMPSAQEVADAVWGYQLHRPNGPVTDAGTYLVDSRVLAGPTTGPLVRTADQVWAATLARDNGPHVDAGTYLVDTRASVAPVTSGPVLVSDQVWTSVPDSVVTSRSYNLAVFALVVLVAVVGGVAVGLLSDTRSGGIAGVAALVGGLLAVILRNLPSGGGRHRE